MSLLYLRITLISIIRYAEYIPRQGASADAHYIIISAPLMVHVPEDNHALLSIGGFAQRRAGPLVAIYARDESVSGQSSVSLLKLEPSHLES